MTRSQHWFLFIHVYGSAARTPLFQGLDQRSPFDDRRAARIDDERAWFHARKVLALHDPARLRVERQVEADHVGFREERVAARSDLEARLACARCRAFPPPADDAHAEGFAHARDDAADLAVGVNAERLAAQAGADRALPFSVLHTLDFLRDTPQR